MAGLTSASGSLNTISSSQFESLRRDASWIESSQQGGIQVGVLKEQSTESWALAPSYRSSLVSALNSSQPVEMLLYIKWRRAAPETKLWQEYELSRTMAKSEQAAFLNLLLSPSSTNTALLPDFIPRYFTIPQSEPVYDCPLVSFLELELISYV